MQAPSNRAATPEAPQARQQNQISVPAEEIGSSLLAERDIYEETCNNTPLAKLFRATNLSTLVEKLCSLKYPWIKPEEISEYFECAEFKEALKDPASEVR